MIAELCAEWPFSLLLVTINLAEVYVYKMSFDPAELAH